MLPEGGALTIKCMHTYHHHCLKVYTRKISLALVYRSLTTYQLLAGLILGHIKLTVESMSGISKISIIRPDQGPLAEENNISKRDNNIRTQTTKHTKQHIGT